MGPVGQEQVNKAWFSLFQTIYTLTEVHTSTQNDSHTFWWQQIAALEMCQAGRGKVISNRASHGEITSSWCKFSPLKQSRSREKKNESGFDLPPTACLYLPEHGEPAPTTKSGGCSHTGRTCFLRQQKLVWVLLYHCLCTAVFLQPLEIIPPS